jgi:hypothetical protein
MEKVASVASMLREGWMKRTINKVKVLVLEIYGVILIGRNNNAGNWELNDLLDVVKKLGRPFKTHMMGGQITTLEYVKD